jgi:hypothetical protein
MASGFIDNALYKLFAHSLATPRRKNVNVPDSPRIPFLQVRVSIQAANCDHVLVAVNAKQCFTRLCELVYAAEILFYKSIKKFKALLPCFGQQWLEIC